MSGWDWTEEFNIDSNQEDVLNYALDGKGSKEAAQDSSRSGPDEEAREEEGQAPAQSHASHALSCGQTHDTYGEDLAFPDSDDAAHVNHGILEEMPETGGHAIWDPGMLDSALHRPQQRAVYDEDCDVFDLASELGHAVVQNHAFENGNHRTAHILTHAFLEANGFGHVVDGDDDEFARHLMGYTSHGQAKNDGEVHTPEETAAMFRARHAAHMRGEKIHFNHHDQKEGHAPLMWCPNCGSSHNLQTYDKRICWNCKETYDEKDGITEDPHLRKPEEKTAHDDENLPKCPECDEAGSSGGITRTNRPIEHTENTGIDEYMPTFCENEFHDYPNYLSDPTNPDHLGHVGDDGEIAHHLVDFEDWEDQEEALAEKNPANTVGPYFDGEIEQPIEQTKMGHVGQDGGRHHLLGLPNFHPEAPLEQEAPVVDESIHEGARPKAMLGYSGETKVWYDPLCPEHKLPNGHLSITGESGSGKTQSMKTIVAELNDSGVTALVLDFKDDYSDKEYANKEGFKVYDPTKNPIPLNPLAPPADPQTGEVNTTFHSYQLSEILGRIYRLGELQSYNLRQAMMSAYQEKGIPSKKFVPDEHTKFPQFGDLQRHLAAKDEKGKSQNAELLGHLSPLFDFGLFDSEEPDTLAHLIDANTVVRLAQLPGNEVKNSVAEFFLMALYNHLIQKPQSIGITNLLVLDEAWRVIHSPFLEPLLREGRAFGLAVLVATQFPSDLPLTVSGNAATQIYFSQSDPSEVSTIEAVVAGNGRSSEADRVGEAVRSLQPLHFVLHNKQYTPFISCKANPYFSRYQKVAHDDGSTHIHDNFPVLQEQGIVKPKDMREHLTQQHPFLWHQTGVINDLGTFHDMEHTHDTPSHVHVDKPSMFHPLRYIKDLGKEAHVGEDYALHHGNSDELRKEHPYGDPCQSCNSLGLDVNAKPCADCRGVGIGYDMEYWDSDEQMHDFPNYPNFQQMKVDPRGLNLHLETGHRGDKPERQFKKAPWAEHMKWHGKFNTVDPETAGLLGLKAAHKADYDHIQDPETGFEFALKNFDRELPPGFDEILKDRCPRCHSTDKNEANIEGGCYPGLMSDGRRDPWHAQKMAHGEGSDHVHDPTLPNIYVDKNEGYVRTPGEGLREALPDCPKCLGRGTNAEGRECDTCLGFGKIPQKEATKTQTWWKKQRDTILNQVGKDRSKTIYTFPDQWSIKKLQTAGDATYEGTMMRNCIKDQNQKFCPSCEGSGSCRNCAGDGYLDCGNCKGQGEVTCPIEHHTEAEADNCKKCQGRFIPCTKCDSRGTIACPKCEEGSFGACKPCQGEGRIVASPGTSLDDTENNYLDAAAHSTIHSLRDPDNIPKVSFCLSREGVSYNNWFIDEVHGLANEDPKKEHTDRVFNFFKDFVKDKPGDHSFDGQEMPWAIHQREHVDEFNNPIPGMTDLKCQPCQRQEELEDLEKTAQSWDNASTYTMPGDVNIPASNEGQRGPYDPWKDVSQDGQLVIKGPKGKDVKQWVKHRTFPGDKPFADHPTNQDHVDMGQVVGGWKSVLKLNQPGPHPFQTTVPYEGRPIVCKVCGEVAADHEEYAAKTADISGDTTSPIAVDSTPNFRPPTPRGKDPWLDLGDVGLPEKNPDLIYDEDIGKWVNKSRVGAMTGKEYVQKAKAQVKKINLWGGKYRDRSKTVHKFEDGWSIKRLNTYGDLRYEGNMMGNCIAGVAEQGCDSCEETGACGNRVDDPEDMGRGWGRNQIHPEKCRSCRGTNVCSKCKGAGTKPLTSYTGRPARENINNTPYPVKRYHALGDTGAEGTHIYSLRDPNNIPKVSFFFGQDSYNTHTGEPRLSPPDWHGGESEDCYDCHGTGFEGRDSLRVCDTCDGTGSTQGRKYNNGETLSIDSIYGRDNQAPQISHAQRIVEYGKSLSDKAGGQDVKFGWGGQYRSGPTYSPAKMDKILNGDQNFERINGKILAIHDARPNFGKPTTHLVGTTNHPDVRAMLEGLDKNNDGISTPTRSFNYDQFRRSGVSAHLIEPKDLGNRVKYNWLEGEHEVNLNGLNKSLLNKTKVDMRKAAPPSSVQLNKPPEEEAEGDQKVAAAALKKCKVCGTVRSSGPYQTHCKCGGELELTKKKKAGWEWLDEFTAQDLSWGGYDPVRDVSPTTKSAPAPSAQGSGSDPWVDLGDNGTAPPRPGYIWDPKMKRWITDSQQTWPEENGPFPGAGSDVNKMGSNINDYIPTEGEPTCGTCEHGPHKSMCRKPVYRYDGIPGNRQARDCRCDNVTRPPALDMSEQSGWNNPRILDRHVTPRGYSTQAQSGGGQEVGQWQADNGIEDPVTDSLKNDPKTDKLIPASQLGWPSSNDNLNVSIDNQNKTGALQEELTDLQNHLLRSHPMTAEIPQDEFPEIPQTDLDEMHMEEHMMGENDHNPEVLRVAGKED